MAETSEPKPNDPNSDTISLDDLVAAPAEPVASTSFGGAVSTSSGQPPPNAVNEVKAAAASSDAAAARAAAPAKTEAGAITPEPPAQAVATTLEASLPPPNADAKVAAIDDFLQTEDPEFAGSMRELEAQGKEAPAADIETLDLAKLPDEGGSKFRKRVRAALNWLALTSLSFMRAAKAAAVHSKHAAFHGAKASKTYAIAAFHWFRGLDRRAKLSVVASLILGVLALSALNMALRGSLRPHFGPPFLHSLADVADAKFTYNPEEPFDDFSDPMFQVEHVVEIERMVVNLKRRSDALEGENPMGLFAFYLAASSQEAAVELKDREAEARDVMSRAIEQMTYEDLSSPEGKERLKAVIRKSLNAFLSMGQVRRVFLKNVVLKN